MKALYIRFVLFLIGPAIREELRRHKEQQDKESAALMLYSRELSEFIDTRVAQWRRR
ncbi:hypothetical protein [Herbaspirillum sp. NPDC101397]|uniref:hypothetical protein n=1 Tax=Herbaspirillum sp. NPDC101397 TaxID=3364006 RepID=UPI00383AFEB0